MILYYRYYAIEQTIIGRRKNKNKTELTVDK